MNASGIGIEDAARAQHAPPGDLVLLEPAEVLAGFDAVSTLYPHIPSLLHWRAWEHAAYRRHRLDGRVLDLGCGDGRYFRLVWPGLTETVGVDADPGVVQAAKAAGVYRSVHLARADRVDEPSGSFDHVFANCSLEHMENLDATLAEVARCLRPGGTLLCSVVTEKFVEWSTLPRLVELAGFSEAAAQLEEEFLAFHKLANPLTAREWRSRLVAAGLRVQTHVPILPRFNTAAFLLADSLWHVRRRDGGELGETIHRALASSPTFAPGFRQILAGLLTMETDWTDCSGAVFQAVKRQ
jgi:SAM-dependent methyltransferase